MASVIPFPQAETIALDVRPDFVVSGLGQAQEVHAVYLQLAM